MKKLILTTLCIALNSFSNPIFAQVDPGDDPDITPVPIDDYAWVLFFAAAVIAFWSFKKFYANQEANSNI